MRKKQGVAVIKEKEVVDDKAYKSGNWGEITLIISGVLFLGAMALQYTRQKKGLKENYYHEILKTNDSILELTYHPYMSVLVNAENKESHSLIERTMKLFVELWVLMFACAKVNEGLHEYSVWETHH